MAPRSKASDSEFTSDDRLAQPIMKLATQFRDHQFHLRVSSQRNNNAASSIDPPTIIIWRNAISRYSRLLVFDAASGKRVGDGESAINREQARTSLPLSCRKIGTVGEVGANSKSCPA